MNTLLNDHEDDIAEAHRQGGRRDREITLGTSMVLGIFFCLAAICAVFFGFGYSIGRKSVPTGTVAAGQSGSLAFNAFKPAPGSPVGAPLPGTTSPLAATPLAGSAASSAPAPLPPPARPAPATKAAADDAAARAATIVATAAVPEAAVEKPVPARSVPSAPVAAPVQPAAQPPASANAGSGSSLVQVAAVSHQEDADMLVSTLKRRGYAVAIRTEPQDKLMHVQIGPFASRKDADAMRLRLQNDGFNAIVK